MIRTPAPASENQQASDPKWKRFESLASAASKAKLPIVVRGALDRDGDERLWEMFSRAYEKHLGKRPWHKLSSRYIPSLCRAAALCDKKKYDLATYIEAQMFGLKKFLASPNGKKVGFQPNMLTSPKAVERYFVFVAAAKSRYGTARQDAFHDPVPLRQAERILSDAIEFAIRSSARGRKRTLSEAIDLRGGDESHQMLDKLNVEQRRYVELRSAVSAVELIRPGWSERIGFLTPLDLDELIVSVSGMIEETEKPKQWRQVESMELAGAA